MARSPSVRKMPAAGAGADAEKDGLVVLFGPAEGIIAPGIPVRRVLRVLEEAGLASRFKRFNRASHPCLFRMTVIPRKYTRGGL